MSLDYIPTGPTFGSLVRNLTVWIATFLYMYWLSGSYLLSAIFHEADKLGTMGLIVMTDFVRVPVGIGVLFALPISTVVATAIMACSRDRVLPAWVGDRAGLFTGCLCSAVLGIVVGCLTALMNR